MEYLPSSHINLPMYKNPTVIQWGFYTFQLVNKINNLCDVQAYLDEMGDLDNTFHYCCYYCYYHHINKQLPQTLSFRILALRILFSSYKSPSLYTSVRKYYFSVTKVLLL